MNEPMTEKELREIEALSEKVREDKLPPFSVIFRPERELALDAVPRMVAEIRRLRAENEALRHNIASMTDEEPKTYAANSIRVTVTNGCVSVDYEGGQNDE